MNNSVPKCVYIYVYTCSELHVGTALPLCIHTYVCVCLYSKTTVWEQLSP